MAKRTATNFSCGLIDQKFVDVQREQVKHPLVKQIMSQVLAEGQEESAFGSSFGEAAPVRLPGNR